MSTVLMLAAYVVWLGGLFRLAGEAIAALVSKAGPRVGDILPPLFIGLIVFVVEAVLLWRWSWFRGLIRQTNEDLRVFYGLPPQPVGRAGPSRQPAALTAGLIVLAALIGAVLLPGPPAAAIALVAGFLVRVGVLVVAAR